MSAAPLAHGTIAPPPSGAIPTTITEEVEVTTPGETTHARDLGAELASAIGSPASCIDLATARSLGGHLRIRVTATVMATGSITRATASGSGLSSTATDCIEERAVHAHLAAPIEGAPRGISTTLEYEVATTGDTRTTTTPEIPLAPGAVAPAIVTPALAPDGPVRGSVAPDLRADGRPVGSVAPDHVLPAQAP